MNQMNRVLALVRSARNSATADVGLRSESLLVALLALHEQTLAQLKLERLGAAGEPDFLNGMIAQHENAVRVIRAELESTQMSSREAPAPAAD
jgi:hypothetical protein